MEAQPVTREQLDHLLLTLAAMRGYLVAINAGGATIERWTPLPEEVAAALHGMRHDVLEAYEQGHQLQHQLYALVPGAAPTYCLDCLMSAPFGDQLTPAFDTPRTGDEHAPH